MPSTVRPSGVQTVPGGQKPFWHESMQRLLRDEHTPERQSSPLRHEAPLRPRPAGTQMFAARPVRERMAALQPKPVGQPAVGVQRSMQIWRAPISGDAQIPERQSRSVLQGVPIGDTPPVSGGSQTSKPSMFESAQAAGVPRMRGQSAFVAQCPVHHVPAPPQTPSEVAH